MGYAFGALTALESCRELQDFKYLILQDPWFYPVHEELAENKYVLSTIKVPVLLVCTELSGKMKTNAYMEFNAKFEETYGSD